MKVKLKAVLYSILQMLAVALGICLVLVGAYYLSVLLQSVVAWLKTFEFFSVFPDGIVLFTFLSAIVLVFSLIYWLVVVFLYLYDSNLERLEGNPQNEEVGD